MPIICPDALLYNGAGQYEWSPNRCREAWRSCLATWRSRDARIKRAIIMCGLPGSGKSTIAARHDDAATRIFDATNTIPGRVCAMIRDSPVEYVAVVVVDTPINLCYDRNDKRTPDRKVPADVMDRMSRQFDVDAIKAAAWRCGVPCHVTESVGPH